MSSTSKKGNVALQILANWILGQKFQDEHLIPNVNVGGPDFLNQNNVTFNGVFGSKVVANRYEQFTLNFTYAPDTRLLENLFVGSGTFSIVNSLATAETGTTTGSIAEVFSKRTLRYKAGRDAEAIFTAIFTPGTGDSRIRVGLFDNEDGVAMGTIGSEFAVMRQYDGVWVDEITQDDFNVDKLDGTGNSEFLIDITKNNIFRINYGYLGIAPIYYQVYGGKDKGWITFHIIDLTNQITLTHTKSPYLPLHLLVDNGTTTDNVKFEGGSLYAGTYATEGIFDASARRFSIDIAPYTVSGTTEQRFVVFHNKPTFQGKANKIGNILAIFQASLDAGSKSAKVRIYEVPAVDVVGGTFVDVDTQNSNLEYSDALSGLPTVSLTNANLFTVFTIAKDGNIREDVSGFNYVLFPDQYAVFTIETANNSIINPSIDEIELF